MPHAYDSALRSSKPTPIGGIGEVEARAKAKRDQLRDAWKDYGESFTRECDLKDLLDHFKRIDQIRAEHKRLQEENEHKRVVLFDIQIEVEQLERELSDLHGREHMPVVVMRYEDEGLSNGHAV